MGKDLFGTIPTEIGGLTNLQQLLGINHFNFLIFFSSFF